MKTKTPQGQVLEQFKHGAVVVLKASDPVIKFLAKKAKGINYDAHPTRTKIFSGLRIGGSMIAGAIVGTFIRRKQSVNKPR